MDIRLSDPGEPSGTVRNGNRAGADLFSPQAADKVLALHIIDDPTEPPRVYIPVTIFSQSNNCLNPAFAVSSFN